MSDRLLKYEGLGTFLRNQTADELSLTFDEIARVLGGQLPADALTNQFWANIRKQHLSRRKQWLDAGYKAYLEPTLPGVRFVRQGEDSSVGRSPWSSDELDACVRAYREMILFQQAGEKANKTQWRRMTLPLLHNRSQGSYEFRMQNISAVLDDLGLPILVGYLPRKNVGNVRDDIIRLINVHWQRDGLEASTDDPDQLDTRVVSARQAFANNAALIPKGRNQPQRSTRLANAFVRDPNVIGWVLSIANGICELCERPAPFLRKDGQPYLEMHHLRQLAEGGPDQVDNALALCPNCHRNFHHGGDRQSLQKRALQKIKRLVDYPAIQVDGWERAF